MGGATVVTLVTYYFAARTAAPPPLAPAGTPTLAASTAYGACAKNLVIDAKLLRGAAAFGAGWGLTGVCPGPALLAASAGAPAAQLVLAGIVAGALLHSRE
jgi:uncharacterized membrane protein YedE/YeeE